MVLDKVGRRTVLRLSSAAAIGTLAGCNSSEDGGDMGDAPTDT